MATLRLVVADDHPVVRAGLVAVLGAEDRFEVVGEAADGREAVDLVAEHRPDVALLDLRMPNMDGVAATAAISAQYPATRVLILTTYDTDDDITRAVEAGAVGYLLKDTRRIDLIDAIRAAARGESVLSPRVASRLVRNLRQPAAASPSARELEVLRGCAEGLSNAEIGRRLHISEATVKTHLLRVFAKFGTNDRTNAVVIAMERGLL